MNRLAVTTAAIAICAWCGTVLGQSGISKFDDIAGRWTGHASSHRVTIDIDAAGKFTAKSALGSETGAAMLQDGTLIVPLPEHKGALQLALQGEALKGIRCLERQDVGGQPPARRAARQEGMTWGAHAAGLKVTSRWKNPCPLPLQVRTRQGFRKSSSRQMLMTQGLRSCRVPPLVVEPLHRLVDFGLGAELTLPRRLRLVGRGRARRSTPCWPERMPATILVRGYAGRGLVVINCTWQLARRPHFGLVPRLVSVHDGEHSGHLR